MDTYVELFGKIKVRRNKEKTNLLTPFNDVIRLNAIISRINNNPCKKKSLKRKKYIENLWKPEFIFLMRRDRYSCLKYLVKESMKFPHISSSNKDIDEILAMYGLLAIINEIKSKKLYIDDIITFSDTIINNIYDNVIDNSFKENDSFFESLFDNCGNINFNDNE